MSQDPIRVLVVEDSLTVRRHIVDVLDAAPGLSVVGEAADGKEAIESCLRLKPDVITMDMILPVMTGLAATEYIMAYCPTPILIVSASTNRGELFKTFDALAAGAVDVLDKPLGGQHDDAWEQRLVSAVRITSRIRVVTHPRARLGRLGQAGAVAAPPSRTPGRRVVAIGASTGGPSALLTVLRSLPADFQLPILMVLHISEPFGQAMADWLDAQLPLTVRHAKDGEWLAEPGHPGVWMAPPERHLEVVDRRLRLTQAPERHSCRPSVDVLFDSLARDLGAQTIACLLTGMGTDGATGMLGIRQEGGLTIAQDEATSVVFGMPGEAVRIGGACQVLPLADIGPTVGRAGALHRGVQP